MIEIPPWLKREFSFGQPIELIAGVSEGQLFTRADGKWSAKDPFGHLVDLQPLDEQRLHEFLSRAPVTVGRYQQSCYGAWKSPPDTGRVDFDPAPHRTRRTSSKT